MLSVKRVTALIPVLSFSFTVREKRKSLYINHVSKTRDILCEFFIFIFLTGSSGSYTKAENNEVDFII